MTMTFTGVQVSVCILVAFICILPSQDALTSDNWLIGIKFLNYTNYNGTLANGQCCDDPSKVAPNCPPDECDTSFQPCGQIHSKTKCDAFPSNAYPTMFDNNSFVLDKVLGNGIGYNTSATLTVFKIPFSTDVIYFNITAYEVSDPNPKQEIATWSFQINWTDPLFKPAPDYRDYLLKDDHAELGLKVVSQCEKHFYGPTCAIYCSKTYQYTCFHNGTKNCSTGWTGKDCNIMIDHCPGHLCENGGTCNNSLTGYTCICPPLFSGQYCEVDLSTTTTTKATTQTTASSTLPTTTTPTTTTKVTTLTTSVVRVNNTIMPAVSTKPKRVVQKSDDSYIIWVVIGVIGILALITGMAAGGYYYKKKSEGKIRPDSPTDRPESPVQMSQNTSQRPVSPVVWEDPSDAW